jgi:hypothetical protein
MANTFSKNSSKVALSINPSLLWSNKVNKVAIDSGSAYGAGFFESYNYF